MNAFIQLMLERHNWLVKTIRVPSSQKKKKKTETIRALAMYGDLSSVGCEVH